MAFNIAAVTLKRLINLARTQNQTARFINLSKKWEMMTSRLPLWILYPFEEQQPLGPLVHIFKNDFCQQPIFSRWKLTEFWVGVLAGSYKNIAIQALNDLVRNPTTYLAEKGFSVLVDTKTKKEVF